MLFYTIFFSFFSFLNLINALFYSWHVKENSAMTKKRPELMSIFYEHTNCDYHYSNCLINLKSRPDDSPLIWCDTPRSHKLDVNLEDFATMIDFMCIRCHKWHYFLLQWTSNMWPSGLEFNAQLIDPFWFMKLKTACFLLFEAVKNC